MLLCVPSTQIALKRHGARLKRLTFATSPAPRSFPKEGPFKRSSDGDAAAAADDGAAADGAIDVEQDQNAQEAVAVLKHTIYCVSAPFTVCV